MEANKNKPSMDFGVIPGNKKSSVKQVKESKVVKKEKVTKPRKQKVVIEKEETKRGRKRHVPEDWVKIGVKIAPEVNNDLKIALVHFRDQHASQDVFVNTALDHYIKFLSKK